MLDIEIKLQGTSIFGIFDDVKIMLFMRKELKIYPIAVGTLPYSLQNKVLGPPFILNSLQLQYLFEINLIPHDPQLVSVKFKIFKHFTQLKYIVKDGFKFGCDFLIYRGDPICCHAEAMVCENSQVDILRMIELCRIANDTNKKMIFAFVVDGKVKTKEVAWVNTGAR